MAELSVKVEINEEKFQEMIEDFKRKNPDFVEVVRCKDCIYRDLAYEKDHKTISETEVYCCWHEERVDNNYFCATGRKGNIE